MRRKSITPRDNYQSIVADQGLVYHENYWVEKAYYEFTSHEVDMLYDATKELYHMYEQATDYIIENNLWSLLQIPRQFVSAIVDSWKRRDPTIYGRFDLAYNGYGYPKLLEFNADTPTSLIEAAVVQWLWKEDCFPDKDQYNSIHEELVEAFRSLPGHDIAFTCVTDSVEDYVTTDYLAACAVEAEKAIAVFDISELAIDSDHYFTRPLAEGVKGEYTQIDHLFKLYPYEWLFREEGANNLLRNNTQLYEPLWKALWSNKYMLVILAKLFPFSPYILKASDTELGNSYCKKPIYSREGANVTLVKYGNILEQTDGGYGNEGYIYQELATIDSQDGMYPIIGAWVVNGTPCGIGIRETPTLITNNMSHFVPHIISF